MTILGRFLMLVTCVPLIQPAGFCVCMASQEHFQPSNQHTVQITSHSHQYYLKADGCLPELLDDHLAETEQDLCQSCCPLSHEHEDEHNHLPGCPASVTFDRFEWVEPGASLTYFASIVVSDNDNTEMPGGVRHRLDHSLRIHGPSTPRIYLTQCSLVI